MLLCGKCHNSRHLELNEMYPKFINCSLRCFVSLLLQVPQCCLEPADVCLLPVGDKNLCRLVFEAVNVPVFLNELSTTIGDIAGHFSSTGAAIEYINK